MKTLAEKIAVMQAAARDEPIEAQLRGTNNRWALLDSPKFDWVNWDYRVAPKKEAVKYKRFLWRTSTGPAVLCAQGSARTAEPAISWWIERPEFIRWIDDDWQTVEI